MPYLYFLPYILLVKAWGDTMMFREKLQENDIIQGEAKGQDKAMEVFYAMTLYNLKEHSKAMEILLNIIVQTSLDEGIKKYKKAIEFYSDKLDEVW